MKTREGEAALERFDCELRSKGKPMKAMARFQYQESNTLPSFYKAIANTTLHCLDIPISFVREHGGKFRRRVTLETPAATSGGRPIWHVELFVKFSPLQVRVQSRNGGWKGFVKDNHIQPGDGLLFSLVAMSRFIVHVYPKLERLQKQQPLSGGGSERCFGHSASFLSGNWRWRRADALDYLLKPLDELICKKSSAGGINWTTRPSLLERSSLKQMNRATKECTMQLQQGLRFKGRRESLHDSIPASPLPSFAKQLSRTQADERNFERTSVLEVPMQFATSHGRELRDSVKLEGPKALIEVRLSIHKEAGRKTRCKLSTVWKDFYDANNFHKMDTLLFTLVSPSHFTVQVLDNCKNLQ